MFHEDDDRTRRIERLEITQLISAGLGSLSLGAGTVVAFTEFIREQPDRLFVAGALAIVALTSLTLTNAAGNKMTGLNSMPDSDAQPGIRLPPDQLS